MHYNTQYSRIKIIIHYFTVICQHLVKDEPFVLDPDSPKKAKMKHLQRQYSSVRRKLEELEREQEEARGFSLSRAEKLKSKPMQKLMAEMSKLKVSASDFLFACSNWIFFI